VNLSLAPFAPFCGRVGLAGRLSALDLFTLNVIAVISYAHVLLSEGFEAAVAQHYLWGFMLLVLVVYGPVALSAEDLPGRKFDTPP